MPWSSRPSRRIKDGDTTEHAGPHCRWCVRKTECAAFAVKHQDRAAAAFDDDGIIQLTGELI